MVEDITSKAALRKTLKDRRNDMPAAFRESAGERVIDYLVNDPIWQRANTIALYRSIGSELNPLPLTLRASAARKRFVYPRIESPGIMTFRDPGQAAGFESTALGIHQPGDTAAEVYPEQIDLIVVPLLGWDDRGYRLGYGGGYYDRYLARTGADIVGVGFDALQVPTLPVERHDIRLDWLVTETGIRRFGEALLSA